MKNLLFLYRFFLLFLLAFACSPENPPSVQNDIESEVAPMVFRNVSYGLDEEQKYDLHLPADRSSSFTPVLILIHGGGWIQGDKADMDSYISLMQELHPSHAIVNLNYRLAGLGNRPAFPNQFIDLQQAIEQLSEDAEELDIQEEFGLIGVSAGAHLALQYDSVYDLEDKVKLVCSIVGPTNFTDPFYTENPDFESAFALLMDESAYPQIQDFPRAVIPAYNINQNTSPTLLFYGESDPLVPLSNGTFLQEQLNAAGITNEFTSYQGGHGDRNSSDREDLQQQLQDFIELHLPARN